MRLISPAGVLLLLTSHSAHTWQSGWGLLAVPGVYLFHNTPSHPIGFLFTEPLVLLFNKLVGTSLFFLKLVFRIPAAVRPLHFFCTNCSLVCSCQATYLVDSLAFYWARFQILTRGYPFEDYSIIRLVFAYWLGLSSILLFKVPVYCSISNSNLVGLLFCFCISYCNLLPVHCKSQSTLPILKI